MYPRLAAIAVAMAASPAFAAPPGSGESPIQVEVNGVVETNVTNTIDANVTNTIDAANLSSIDFAANFGGNGFISVGLPEGRLHASSVSLHSTANGELCRASVVLALSTANGPDEQPLGLNTMSSGAAQTASIGFSAPIEVAFGDEILGARYKVNVRNEGTGTCWVQFSGLYEGQSQALDALSDQVIVREF